jgi:hypothetical protein
MSSRLSEPNILLPIFNNKLAPAPTAAPTPPKAAPAAAPCPAANYESPISPPIFLDGS